MTWEEETPSDQYLTNVASTPDRRGRRSRPAGQVKGTTDACQTQPDPPWRRKRRRAVRLLLGLTGRVLYRRVEIHFTRDDDAISNAARLLSASALSVTREMISSQKNYDKKLSCRKETVQRFTYYVANQRSQDYHWEVALITVTLRFGIIGSGRGFAHLQKIFEFFFFWK